MVGDLHELLDLLLPGHEIGVGGAERLHLGGDAVEILGGLLELLGEDLPPHPQHHRAFGRGARAAVRRIHRQLGHDLGPEILLPVLEPLHHRVAHRLEPLHGRVVFAAGAPLGLVGHRLLDPGEPFAEFGELRISEQHGIDRLLGNRLFQRDLAAVLGVHDRQFGVDQGQVALRLVELGAEGLEVVEQQAPLGGHLGAVGGAERLGEVVVGVEVCPHLGHVFLVFPLQRVAPLQPLRLLLVDHVGEVGLRDRVDDLRDVLGILAAHADLHDFRLHRRRNLDVPHQIADRVILVGQDRERRDTRPPQRRREHERALDQLDLRLAVGLVFRVVTATADAEHARLVADTKPRRCLVAAGQEQPGENPGERGERECQGCRRQPAAAEGMPHPAVVETSRERIGHAAIGSG